MTLEMGKVYARAWRGEYGAEFFSGSPRSRRIAGRYTKAPAGTGRIIVTKSAVGPCCITPWNFHWRWAPARSVCDGGGLHDDHQARRNAMTMLCWPS